MRREAVQYGILYGFIITSKCVHVMLMAAFWAPHSGADNNTLKPRTLWVKAVQRLNVGLQVRSIIPGVVHAWVGQKLLKCNVFKSVIRPSH